MPDEFNVSNIIKADYNFDTAKYFFNADVIRIIIIIFIIISFVFNFLYFISSLKAKVREEIHKINLILMRSILLINFLHTFSYFYEWVLQNVEDNNSLYVTDEGDICPYNIDDCKGDQNYNEIGGLLIGNMFNMSTCQTQGFFLIFSSLSQDLIISIFFYLINKSSRFSKAKIYILILLTNVISLIISIIIIAIDGIGLNDKFCFIKKFIFDNEEKTYKLYSGFIPIVIVYYLLRLAILIISSCFLYRIVKYIRKNKLGKMYIFKLCSFIIVQIISITVGIMYRFGGMISRKFSRDFVNIFLIVNTIDGVIFPSLSYFTNNMYKTLCNKNTEENLADNLLTPSGKSNDVTANNITMNDRAHNNDKSNISSTRDNNNNFDLSYI